nr:hypothetical protein [Tanacetum cinerariifolium]
MLLSHNLEMMLQSRGGVSMKDREGVAAKQSRDDALIKGRSINEGEAIAERINNDSEEIARVLTSMDAATVRAEGIDVPTGSGFIPTAGPPTTVISTGSEVGPTASPIVTRRKGNEVMVESDTLKKKKLQEHIDAQVAKELEEQQEKESMRMNEQIARDAEVVRIHAEEELQGMIDSLDKSNETIAKYLQEYQDFASELPLEKRIELISDLRKGLNLEKEQVKKQKSSEEAPETETSTEEFTKEKMKEMMQLEVTKVYLESKVVMEVVGWLLGGDKVVKSRCKEASKVGFRIRILDLGRVGVVKWRERCSNVMLRGVVSCARKV